MRRELVKMHLGREWKRGGKRPVVRKLVWEMVQTARELERKLEMKWREEVDMCHGNVIGNEEVKTSLHLFDLEL